MSLAPALPPGPVDLTTIETDATPGFDGKKADGKETLAAMGDELAELQERLWALRSVRHLAVGSCWCCRAWTPPARAAPCGTPSA